MISWGCLARADLDVPRTVWMLNTNEWRPRITIPSADIADLSEAHSAPQPAPVRAPPPNASAAAPTTNVPPTVAPIAQPGPPPAFVDPAIVAVGKQPVLTPSVLVPETRTLPNTSNKQHPNPVIVPSAPVESGSQEVTPTAAVAASLQRLKVGGNGALAESAGDKDDEDATDSVLDYGEVTGQKKKRRQRKPGTARTSQEDFQEFPAPATKTAGKGKGWRQTPILQSTSSFQPFSSLKRNGAKGRQTLENGWASEDVTDVQEMGDFDFEGSLAKFDKRNLFEHLRKADRIDEADRLVSHNRKPRPKPGTAGGKNLHYSENVLDMPNTLPKPPKDRPASKETTPNDFWNSEADDGIPNNGERPSGRETGMGSRQSSRRGEAKVSGGRRSQSRRASEMARTGSGPSRVNSGVSHYHRDQSLKGSRSSSRLSSRTATADSKRKQLPTSAAQQGLYLLPSNRRIETVSPLQMLNLENIAHHEIGLTEEIMTENAGRSIAEVTLTALSDPAIKVRHAGTVDPATGNPPPQTVVVLAGNNKSGSRAVAAARHLRNKGINLLLCVVGLERSERDLLEDVRRQVRLYKNLGGRVFTKSDLFEHLRKISIPMLTIDTPRTSLLSSLARPAPVLLIVDALLGLAISFEELRSGDQATVYELVEWANRNEAFALAVDVPTGIDPTTGKVNVIDGSPLYVRPRYVVAVGAPKRGLLEAMIAADAGGKGDGDGGDTALPAAGATTVAGETDAMPLLDDAVSEWKLYLADMGLGQAVWKKAGTKMRKGLDFDGKWVLEMQYRGLGASGEEDELA